MTTTRVEELLPIDHAEAMTLAATENARLVDLLRSLDDHDWSKPTDCDLWDVRALAGHVLGAVEGFSSFGRFLRLMVAAQRAKGDGPMVDGMTAAQVRANAGLSVPELLDRITSAAPAQVRGRSTKLRPVRHARLKQEVGDEVETWKGTYLLDIILTRDGWMHRVDIARATGREVVLTAEHDGRIVADVVAEWARRHGRPFTLTLDGPAGGTFRSGDGGEEFHLDAVEFCRTLSGRNRGTGLLDQEVPF
jgi:uncharacterized protein (TIGR03083 family)